MQQRDTGAFLWDAHKAALAIQSFTTDMEETDFQSNEMAQAAVERKFEIIGEALNDLNKHDPVVGARIPNLRTIVDFRNYLIHGYASVKVSTVWNIVCTDLPPLICPH